MSMARVVITAVVHEGRSQAEVARAYGLSRGWVSKLMARYRAAGEAAFEPRSRRPHTSPNTTPPEVVELICCLRKQLVTQGHDAGPHTIAWHLRHHHAITVSPATISRHLTTAGLITPEPAKRPKSSYIRFQADLPNETWQSDFTHYRLRNGRDIEILTFLDDHSRYALSVTAHPRVTGAIVTEQFTKATAAHGIPAATLTDNGMVYTTRFSGGKGGRNGFETELRRLGITQKNSRPNHPTTCGKVERFQQTLKNWLTAQPDRPRSIAELQQLIDQFVDQYNNHRPHRSLPQHATPATAYRARPKAGPGNRDTDHHYRLRHDTIDKAGVLTLRHNGRLHHLGVGRTYTGTPVVLLIQDLDIRIIHAATGRLLRELTLDPTRDYQPTGAPKGPTKTTKPAEP